MDEDEPTTITITQGEESIELLAEQIETLAQAAERLANSGLSQRAIILLLHDLIGPSRINKTEIRDVLDALPRLSEFLG